MVTTPDHILTLKAADVVAAYVSHNEIAPDEVPKLLKSVIECLMEETTSEAPVGPVLPMPLEETFGHDFIICLEDMKRVTLLKRYLAKNFNLTPEEYCEKWGLPEDYPMVTPEYSARRSQIAKDQGLGKNS